MIMLTYKLSNCLEFYCCKLLIITVDSKYLTLVQVYHILEGLQVSMTVQLYFNFYLKYLLHVFSSNVSTNFERKPFTVLHKHVLDILCHL